MSGSELAETIPQSGQCLTRDETLGKLADNFLAPNLKHLQESEAQLMGLKEHHRVLIESVQQENTKFGDCQPLTEVSELMDKARLYHEKLLNIKKEMLLIHEKSLKMKKRALKLQQEKQKQELQREQQREKEQERERQLAAKPVKPTINKVPSDVT